jgi:hypothetical protein
MSTTHEMIPHQKASAIVANVTQALDDLDKAFTLMQHAKTRLAQTLGDGTHYYHTLWTTPISDYDLPRRGEESARHVRTNAWRYIVAQTGLLAYMTAQRKKEFEQQLDKGDLPDLTTENILGTLHTLAERVPDLLSESVGEIFDWLRPRHDWGVGALKTNNKWKIGPKVIIGGAVERWSRHEPYRLNGYREQSFRTLGNVLSLMDGQGVEQYPHDLVTRLKSGLQRSWVVVDAYATYKAYANGNLHVAFSRQDLVDRINQMAAERHLAPERV